MSSGIKSDRPNTQAAVAFLKAAQPGGPWHLVALPPEGGPSMARSFRACDESELFDFVDENQGEFNLYWHVNELKPGFENRKAKKDDVQAARFLHVDVDDRSALDRILKFEPSPTALISSGGGFQAFWALSEPYHDLEHTERLNQRIAAELGGDNCHNVDRIMRLPETLNLPNAKKRAAGRRVALATLLREFTDWSRQYSVADFEQLPPHPPAPAGALPKPGLVSRAGEIPLVRLEDLPAAVDEYTRGTIALGDDPDRPRGGTVPRHPSRSETVFSVACILARAGCSVEVVAGILINPEYGISESIREKRNPIRYALKQGESAHAAVSDGWPDSDGKGRPRATMRNASVALRRLGLDFGYNLFRHQKTMGGRALQEHAGEISDDGVLFARGLVLDEFGFDPRSDHTRDAITLLCLESVFHPVRDYLAGLEWDGVPRLDGWLSTYLGANETPLNTAIGRMTLVAAVRRVRTPGVKFDQVTVLEGEQGSGKSSAVAILAGPGNHSDQEILSLDAKAQIELLEGVWVYELGEVEGLNRAEVNKIKAFASRTVDRARMAYGRFVVARPRQAIFIGTTNDDKYLRDQTGNRRFWPVRTTTIDLAALARDRDQLWAEAARLEAGGESISLPEGLWEAAAIEQAERLEDDPWLDQLAREGGTATGDVVRVSTAELLGDRLGVPLERQTQHQRKRIATAMKMLGWKAAKYRGPGGATIRGYERAKPADHRDPSLPY